ncbi:MAG: patatin-like phospholipase family protein [[Clostridium] fimetarium]|nr:patatin-like phospholipase family protein [Alistipes timonensis]MCM1405993.1 patatin-like phospholipase family protein [[Clostridium] fimetarium]
MRRMLTIAAALLPALFAPAREVPAAGDSVAYPAGQSVGLVLSGGGAKGIAHIGVIQALEDNDIPIDYVAGTSMGAIVGGLYASGYTPAEMMSMILSPGFANWSTGRVDPALTYYFVRQPNTPAFSHININLSPKDSVGKGADILPTSLISPIPMNFAFMELFSGYTAQCGGDFDRLFVPFRCVTSDVIHKHKIVCRSGSLGDAIRASMSFPAVFQPIKMNGVYVYDGGIYDNFPVDVMREDFAPSFMIGVDVHSLNPAPSTSLVSQLEDMIIQNNDYDLPADEGMKIHVDVSQFSLLDFGKAREIYEIGYNRAVEMMDSLRGRVTSRVPAEARELRRRVFKSATPYVRFDSVKVTGGTKAQNEYLAALFRPKKGTDTFGIEQAKLAYYRAISPGRLRNLVPQARYDERDGLFTLDLAAQPKSNFSLGAGGYLSSTTSSMIFLSASFATLKRHSFDARVMGWIGQSYMAAEGRARLYIPSSLPSALDFEAVYSRKKYYENDKLFYEDSSPTFITHHEGFGRLSYGWAVGRKGKASVAVGGGVVKDRFYANDRGDFTESGRERTTMHLGQAVARLEFDALDNRSFASEGYALRLTAMENVGNYYYRQSDVEGADDQLDERVHWFQAELQAEKYFPLGKRCALGLSADVLVSTRGLLNTYYASLVNAPAFTPTPASEVSFNKAFRANSFAAVGVTPIWKPFNMAQVRLSGYMFLPFRRIEQDPSTPLGAMRGRWFSNPEFIGELDLVYNLPFASICGYVNYLTFPARNWHVGISFGLYFHASSFLR